MLKFYFVVTVLLNCVFQQICPFHLSHQIYWNKVVHNSHCPFNVCSIWGELCSFIFFFFSQFNWENPDICDYITSKYPAWWCDLLLLWNGYHNSFSKHTSPYTDKMKRKGKIYSLWCKFLGLAIDFSI